MKSPLLLGCAVAVAAGAIGFFALHSGHPVNTTTTPLQTSTGAKTSGPNEPPISPAARSKTLPEELGSAPAQSAPASPRAVDQSAPAGPGAVASAAIPSSAARYQPG